jgi:hypothetical protein
LPNQDAFARRRDTTGEAAAVFATTTFRTVDFREADFLATDFFELALSLIAFDFRAFARASARLFITKHRSKELLTRSSISSLD